MLQAENLSYGVRTAMGKPTGFRITNVNFRLGQGYLMVLLGKNGSGKTTLLRLLFGLYQPETGEVLWNGRNFSGAGEMAKSDIRRDIAYVGEEDIFFRQKSIGENAEYFGDFYPDFQFKVFREILEEFDTDTKLLEKTLEELSTGEKKQVQLAFVLARRPKLLILDEPGANLDAVFRVSLMERIQKQIAEDKLSVIISTHILEDVEDIADYVAVMEGGNMEFFGDRDRFFEWMGKETGRMEVKDFARWVKKNNDSDCRKSIFAEAGFAGLAFLYALFGDDNGIGYYGGGALLLVFAAFSIGRHQWERYFYVSEGDIPGKRMPVSQVLRFHAFPAEAYFRYVFSRMNRPFFRILFFSGIMVFLAWEKVGEKGYEMAAFFVGLGIFCAICPYLFGFIMKKHFLFQLKTGNEGMSHLFLRGIAALWTAVECIILVMSLVVGLLLFWIVVSSFLELPMEETVAVCRSYPNKYSIFAVLICIAMWIFGMENNDTKKLSRFFYMISFLSLVSAFVLGTVENYRYTEIAGEEIRIRNFWQEDVYGIEEIQGFRIYEDDGSIQLELDFPDRAVEKSFTGWQSLNDLYEEKYYSEYNFIADYVEKFQKLGIEGELGDVEALEKDVEELDPEVKRGLRRIVELMGNYKTLTKL